MADAPGHPGISPRWTSSAKDGVGAAMSSRSSVWFTHSHGILNEIYYPSVDSACTRDLGLIVTDGTPGGFFSEEKRDAVATIRRYADGVPMFNISTVCRQGRYTIEKHIATDPQHHCLLQQIRLIPRHGETSFRLFVLLAPHLVNRGSHNSAWLGDYKGQRMLFASGGGTSMALACSSDFLARSVGFAGVSDGWQLLKAQGSLHPEYDRAEDGNVALCAELDARSPLLVALGFGRSPTAAAFHAAAGLARGYGRCEAEYAERWLLWQRHLEPLDPARQDGPHNLYRVSTAVLRTHESPLFPGGSIASLSIPWGFSKGDDDIGGYHLVWPRDLVETAGAHLACGALPEARRTLDYLRVIQEADGHWRQNNWLDGTSYWSGTQMDETGFPVLLLDLCFRHGALPELELPEYWPMVQRACAFIISNGPSTGQDRWEENSGYTPATIAVEIAALLVGAELAERLGKPEAAVVMRDTADAWNADLESWLYVSGTDLAQECGVKGYYMRIRGEGDRDLAMPSETAITIKNRPGDEAKMPAHHLVGADVVALVRLGLRSAHDERIQNSLKVIDRLTRVELPQGPLWHRYVGDGYGEHHDGRPFDGTGHGRLWPLLTGERAHCAIAAGDLAEAERLKRTVEGSTSPGGLLPEQVWDADDIPQLELIRGRPSGSAMPLVWAHAEYIKLLRSLRDGAVFDLPPQTVHRYIEHNTRPYCRDWREQWWRSRIPVGQILRVQLPSSGIVVWSADGWQTVQHTPSRDAGLGIETAELATATLPPGSTVEFTWQLGDGNWRGKNFSVRVE
jgi:glucoamylase